jgi:hypothetical protein
MQKALKQSQIAALYSISLLNSQQVLWTYEIVINSDYSDFPEG